MVDEDGCVILAITQIFLESSNCHSHEYLCTFHSSLSNSIGKNTIRKMSVITSSSYTTCGRVKDNLSSQQTVCRRDSRKNNGMNGSTKYLMNNIILRNYFTYASYT